MPGVQGGELRVAGGGGGQGKDASGEMVEDGGRWGGVHGGVFCWEINENKPENISL